MPRTPDDILSDILKQAKPSGNQRGNLPSIRAPQQELEKRAQEQQGWLARLLDLHRRLVEHYQSKRLKTELDTQIKLHARDAARALEMKDFQDKAALEDYKNQASHRLEVWKLVNSGMAEMLKSQEFKNLVDMAADMWLDPLQQEFLIAKLYTVFLSKEGYPDDTAC